jgi:hypothetical protein
MKFGVWNAARGGWLMGMYLPTGERLTATSVLDPPLRMLSSPRFGDTGVSWDDESIAKDVAAMRIVGRGCEVRPYKDATSHGGTADAR